MRKSTLNVLMVILFMLPSIFSFSQGKMHEMPKENVCLMKGYQAPAQDAVNSIFSEDFSGGDFPPAGWSIVGDGQTNWTANTTNNAGGAAPEAMLSWSPQFVGNSKLVTSTIATSSYSALVLEFKHNVNDYGGGYTIKVETTSDGASWNEVWSQVVTGSIGPETLLIMIDNADVGSDNFQVAFTFDGDSYQINQWYIDNVMLSEAVAYDAAVMSLDMPWLIATGSNIEPGAVVMNMGSEVASFDVTFEILDAGSAVYSEVVSVTDLASFGSQNVEFPSWVAVAGSFTAEVTADLTGDENPDNDMMSLGIEVVDGLVSKKPLYEEFTSSTCGPCVPANIAIAAVLDANPDEYTLIKYQMSWPGSGDPYYTEEGGTRRNYYGVSWVPDLYINSNQLDPASSITQEIFDVYANELTALEIEITEAFIDQDLNLTVSADLTPLADYVAGYTAHIVVIEKLTVGNVGTNGETEWHNVMMKMLPDANGTTLDALTTGNQVTLTEAFNMDATFMETPNDLAVVVFVQSEIDKSIVQSAVLDVAGEFDSYEVAFTVENENGDPIEGAEIQLEGNGLATTDAAGQAVYEGVFPGNYAYDVEAAGYFPGSGEISVIDQNVSETAVLEAPDFYYFEMFDAEIPASWTLYFAGWDYLYWYDGQVIFFRQSDTDDPLMLVSEAIDIEPADMIFFDLGGASGDPNTSFGTVTDPTDPTTFTELMSITPGADWETYEYDLSGMANADNDVYFAWRLTNTNNSFFNLDNVIITAGDPPPPPSGDCEGFDELTVGGYAAEQLGGNWTTWSGTPGTAEDAIVSDMYSLSPDNSILVEGTTDLVHLISGENITSGVWSYSLNIYVPTGTTGYWNLQKDVVPGTEWGFQVMFEDDMTIIVDGGAAGAVIQPYEYDTWYNHMCIIDLDNDWCDFYIDGELVLGYQWTLGTFGTAGANTLAGSNIYANPGVGGTPPGAHFDDICFGEVLPPAGECEGFDELTVGGYAAEQLGGNWTTWSGTPGTAEDAIVSDMYSLSPDNSILVEGTTDLVHLITGENITSGKWSYSLNIYVPTGTTGYWNLQKDVVPGTEWGFQVMFEDDMTIIVDGGAAGAVVQPYEYDTWYNHMCVVDLDSDWCDFYIDGEHVLGYQWTLGTFGTAGANTLAGSNIYANPGVGGTPPGAHFDDICFEDLGGLVLDPPTDLASEVIGSDISLTWTSPAGGGSFEPEWIGYSNGAITNSIGTGGAANFDVAVRFTADDLAGFEGGAITSISFVPGEDATMSSYTLKVWQGSGNPTLIYEQALTTIVADDWNEIVLDTPVPFDNTQELWFGFNCNATGGYPAGCDDGPEVEGFGNMMYWEGAWTTLTALAPTLTFNWAVEAYVEAAGVASKLAPVAQTTPAAITIDGALSSRTEKMTPAAIFAPEVNNRALTGFNVYRNGDMIAEDLVVTNYLDEDLTSGTYTYYVTAVYDEGESGASNEVTEVIVSINDLNANVFSMYPNPANAQLNVSSSVEISSVRIMNYAGQLVYSKVVSGTELQINTSEFATGIYVLQLETEAGFSTQKLIIE